MKIEQDTEKPITASAFSDGVGGESTTKSTKSSRFLWNACSNEPQPARINIKRRAVLDGLRLGRRVSIESRKQIEGKNQGLGIEKLADWAEQFNEVEKQYETPHSTVGFIGNMGTGKSTLLNAMIGERNLLPCSNDRSSTAVACRIRYNHGSDGYRAEVVFRSHQSFTEELDKLFENLNEARELLRRLEDEKDARERDSIEEEISDLGESRAETLDTLKILFGVEEDDLESMSATEFLDRHPSKVLGQTMEVAEADCEQMVAKIKPFLDSTPSDQDGKEVILWPLVVEVTLYVPSDFLKHGLELIDLPGVDDKSEGRSRVAERFTKHLDITAIVAPAIRATEEKTVSGLIRKRQENEMRMDGKLTPNSLCVLLSKNEDIDTYGYLKEKWIAKDYPSIKKHLDRAEMLDKIIRTADSGPGKSEPQPPGPSTSIPTSRDSDVEIMRRESNALTESLKQAAVSIRNRSVSERIQQGFRYLQVGHESPKHDQLVDDTIEVFPTSGRAFQAIRHPGGIKEPGFPNERHTGIPRFKQWLEKVTFKNQEEHLDGILRSLFALFARIEHWIIANENPARTLTQGLDEIECIHEQHRRSLTLCLSQTGNKLRRIEPLKGKESALAKCQSEYPNKIKRWAFIYPNKPSCMIKIHGNVQSAILRGNGRSYESKGKKFPHKYEWTDDLNTIFIDETVGDWEHTFQIVLPGYEDRIAESLKPAWLDYSEALTKFCSEHNALQQRSNGKVEQVIRSARDNLAHDAKSVLQKLRKTNAPSISQLFREEIQRTMEPVFQQAYAIKGRGCVAARNDILNAFADKRAAEMSVNACEIMEAQLKSLIERRASDLEKLAENAVSDVREQMKGILGISGARLSPAARENQQRFTEEIRPHLRSWELCWQKERENQVVSEDLSIPEPELFKVKVALSHQ